MRADLFDAATGAAPSDVLSPSDVGAFAGPSFNPAAMSDYLNALAIGEKV